jgi:hypothetical protein
MDADTEDSATISTPQLQTKSLAVTRALSDFEALLNSEGGPISGVDRIHTALHGYFKTLCDVAHIECPDDADITAVFAQIRDKHPKLQVDTSGPEGIRILRSHCGLAQSCSEPSQHGAP